MNKNIVERLNIYKKFFKILIDYARVNISFSITYVSLLMLDSFAKIFYAKKYFACKTFVFCSQK